MSEEAGSRCLVLFADSDTLLAELPVPRSKADFQQGGFVEEARRPDKRKTTATVESIQSIRPIGIQGAEESKGEIPAELHLQTAFAKPGLRPS